MSINVTVSSNPIFVDRGKILLTDVETAKKNEFLRRRKIRLQQVRQQAKDYSQKIRHKVSCEGASVEKQEKERKAAVQNNKKKEEAEHLKQVVEECLSSVGSGHQLASLQAECDALVREKQELQDEIARARGTIAQERMKAEKCFQKEKNVSSIGRKQLVRKVENLRSTLISNLPPVQSVCSSGTKSVHVQVHKGADEIGKQSVASKCSSSNKSPKETIKKNSITYQRKSGTCSEVEDSEDESDDDSDVTWPPRSARVVKEPIPIPKVRFYDHNTREAKECPKPPYSVTSADPYDQPDMSRKIADEEEAIVQKENLNILARRENLIRGNKALRKERDKKDAEILLKEIDEIERRRRIQLAISKAYPSKFHAREYPCTGIDRSSRDDESELGIVTKEDIVKSRHSSHEKQAANTHVTVRDCFAQEKNVIPPPISSQGGTEELLEDLIQKLKEERARKQKKLDNRFGLTGLKENDIPVWVPQDKSHWLDQNENKSRWENILSQTCEDERRLSFEAKTNGLPQREVSYGTPSPNKSPPNRDRHSSGIQSKIGSPKKDCPIEIERLLSPNNDIQESIPGTSGLRSPDNKPAQQRLFSPAKCGCSANCQCFVDPLFEENGVVPLDSVHSNEEVRKRDSIDTEKNKRRHSCGGHPEKLSSCPETSSSVSETSHAETLTSSLTYEGVKVIVKVSERPKKGHTKSPIKVCTDKDVQTSTQDSSKSVSFDKNDGVMHGVTSSSTSYRSLPSKLSPENQSLIRSLLSRLDTQNVNPVLLAYITRLLGMTRESIDNLPVSSASEISISSTIFESPDCFPCSKRTERYDVSCQVENSINDSYQNEVLRYTDVAKTYADRVHDLAGMLDSLNLRSCQPRVEPEETTYMNLPNDCHVSVKLSNSVQEGQYPRPIDLSDIPTSIQPHPRNVTREQTSGRATPQNGFHRMPDEFRRQLSVIQELETSLDASQARSPKLFDPNLSSIRSTPEKKKQDDHHNMNSTSSSLCLLDERDLGTSVFGSSSDDFEDVFRSLGIAWALPTVRKVREARRKVNTSSSSGGGRGYYSHSTPLEQSPARGYSSRHSPIQNRSVRQSPIRDRSVRQSPVKCTSSLTAPSLVHSRQGYTRTDGLRDSDSLTPPSFALNIPQLSHYQSPSE